jgi:hypothetical protein
MESIDLYPAAATQNLQKPRSVSAFCGDGRRRFGVTRSDCRQINIFKYLILIVGVAS